MYVFGWTECLLLLSLFLLVFGPRFLIRSAQRMRRNLGGFKSLLMGPEAIGSKPCGRPRNSGIWVRLTGWISGVAGGGQLWTVGIFGPGSSGKRRTQSLQP